MFIFLIKESLQLKKGRPLIVGSCVLKNFQEYACIVNDEFNQIKD